MTITKKLSMGFITVALLVLAVGSTGFLAMQLISNKLNNILVQDLPTKDVSMEAMISVLSSRDATSELLLCNETNLEKIHDNLNESEMWLSMIHYGTDSKEFTDSPQNEIYQKKEINIQTNAITKSGKSITTELLADIVKYRSLLSQIEENQLEKVKYYFNYANKKWNIVDYMTLVELQHLKWLENLRLAAEGNTRFTSQTDHTKCFFGKWFYSFNVADPKLNALLKELEPIHERLHKSAIKINTLTGAAKKAEYRQTVIPIKAEIKQKLADILHYSTVQVKKLQEKEDLVMAEVNGIVNAMEGKLKELEIITDTEIINARKKANQDRTTASVIIALLVLFSFIVSIIIGKRISIPITESIKKIIGTADKIAEGNSADPSELTVNKNSTDEIKHLLQTFLEMSKAIEQKVQVLTAIAHKDLSQVITKSSEEDKLGTTLEKLQFSLSETMSEVLTAVNQVHSGADHLAQSSQDLSEGATSQAASIEEISTAISVVNEQAKGNASMADKAKSIAEKTAESAETCDAQMIELSTIMESVKKASEKISTVVHVIDEIAFQTNLLALNAAVEAARAGQHGKGFAVVADEVRNLAGRSAKAVSETTDMIDSTLMTIKHGVEATERTAQTLRSMIDDTVEIVTVSKEIAESSSEQSVSIDEVSRGLDQISTVTQSNSATAEESASSSEELSAQAEMLANMVHQFKLNDEQLRYPPVEEHSLELPENYREIEY